MKSHDANDIERQGNIQFSEENVRRAFIRKVYAIVLVQLMITFGFVAMFVFIDPLNDMVSEHREILWIALGVSIVFLFVLFCCENVRRTYPMNYICLAIFTIAESIIAGCCASIYAPNEVFLAIGITVIVCLALTIFAMQTAIDFTVCGGVLLVATIILIVMSLVGIFFPNKILTTVYCSCGAVVFSLYLLFDTQMMLGGKHKSSISPEEYIYAALSIYLDIIYIFYYILQLIGLTNK